MSNSEMMVQRLSRALSASAEQWLIFQTAFPRMGHCKANAIASSSFSKDTGSRLVLALHLGSQLENTTEHSPTQNDVVVKEVHLDVLEANGLVEALRDKEPEESTEIWSVEQGDTHVLWKSLQEWKQHSARVLPTCMRGTEETPETYSYLKDAVLTARQTTSLGTSLFLGSLAKLLLLTMPITLQARVVLSHTCSSSSW